MLRSKGRLFLASDALTRVHFLNRAESKCVPPSVRSNRKTAQIFVGGKKKKTLWHMKLLPLGPDFVGLWCFNNEAVTVQLRQAVMFKGLLCSQFFLFFFFFLQTALE